MANYRGKPLYFGRNMDTGRRFTIAPDRLVEHTLLVGGTGSGKTVYLEGLARQAIQDKTALIFLDPKGTTYERLVSYCYRRRIMDKLYIIDPNDDRYRVGLNYFDLGDYSTAKKIGLVKEAIYRAMGRQRDADLTITFERWGGAALSLIDSAGLTLADFHSVLTDERVRQAALQLNRDPFIQQEWRHFGKLSAREQEANLKASINRAALFAQDQVIYEMIGQPNAIDWQAVMNEGGIVLVNLAPRRATEELCRFLGIMLIHQIYHAALERPKKFHTTPCYVIADEFADIVCPDFKEGLQKSREFGVGFILSLLNLIDLRGVNPDNPDAMLTSVLQNTETKLVLRMRDYDGAVMLARALYGAQTTGLEVKATQTSAIPHVYEEDVTVTTSSSSRTGGGSSSGIEVLSQNGLHLSSAQGTVTLDSWAEGDSVATTRQQRVRYDYEQVPVYWSLDETFHRHAAALQKQKPGEGSLQYAPDRPVIRIKSDLPQPLAAEPAALADYTAAICERMHALPPTEARALITGRMTALLSAPAEPAKDVTPYPFGQHREPEKKPRRR